MFADFIRLVNRRSRSDYERGFIQEVRVRRKSPRNRGVERLFLACWVVIAAKCVLVAWLFKHYQIAVNPMWVIAPTVVFAALCTAVYLLRD